MTRRILPIAALLLTTVTLWTRFRSDRIDRKSPASGNPVAATVPRPDTGPDASGAVDTLRRPGPASRPAQDIDADPGDIEADLRAFRSWAEEYVRQPDSASLPFGIERAQRRRVALKSLIENDPRRALENALPEHLRRALPTEFAPLIEERVDGRGDLTVTAVTAGDGVAPAGRQAVWYEARMGDGREFEAFVYGNRQYQPSREDIPVHGIALDGSLAVGELPGRILEPLELAEAIPAVPDPVCTVSQQPAASTGTATGVLSGDDVQFFCGPAHAQATLDGAAEIEALRPPGLGQRATTVDAASGAIGEAVPALASDGDATWTTGTKTIMVARVRFSDGWEYSDLDESDCAQVVDDISERLLSWSYGRYRVLGVGAGGSAVSPVIPLKKRANEYTGKDVGGIWTEVQDRLKALGIAGNHDLLLVLAGNAPIRDPNDSTESVTWGGIGRVGAGLSLIRVNDSSWTTDERIAANVSVSIHEIGHNLGLYHASTAWDQLAFDTFGQQTGDEYGDRYDRMGRGGQAFNARYKQWLNWIDGESLPFAVGPGTFLIREHDLEENAGRRGLQTRAGGIGLGGFYSLFVEYRLRGPVPTNDAPFAAYSDTLRAYGAQIRLGNAVAPKTWLLDATPETPNNEPVDEATGDPDTAGNLDSPLLPGRTFTYWRGGLETHVTNLEADPALGFLRVEVQYGPVPGNDPPTGSITASTPAAAAGQTVLFTAEASDPEDAELAYHWQVAGLNVGRTRPAVFPNARTIAVRFPTNGVWEVSCLVSDKHGGVTRLTRTLPVVNNEPPTLSRITNKTLDEDTTLTGIPFTVSDPTTPASALQIAIRSSNIYLFPFNTITLGGSGTSRTLNFAPPRDRHGTSTVTVTVSDGELTAVEQFTVTVRPVTPGTTLLAAGSAGWRFRADGIQPPENWATPAFDDTGWASGDAPFLYPAPVLPLLGVTVLPAKATRTTCYFRRTLPMPLLLNGTPMIRFRADDGAVVYLNGIEVHRHNMPEGPVEQSTRALISIEGSAEFEWVAVPIQNPRILSGDTLTIAVEVHDAGGQLRGFGDVDFDLEFSTRQAPTVSAFSRQTSPEDQVAGPYTFTATDAETPGGQLFVTAHSSNPALVVDDGIKLTHDVITGQRTIAITPQPDTSGSTVVSLRVSDGVAETWRSFNLTITPVDDPPELAPLADVTAALGEEVPLVELRVSDSDNDPAGLQVTATADGDLGIDTLEVLPGPTDEIRWLRIVPTPGAAARTTITVGVGDGNQTAARSFKLRVNAPESTTSSDVLLVDAGSRWLVFPKALPLTPTGEPVDFTDINLVEGGWTGVVAPAGYNSPELHYPIPEKPYRITTYFRRKFRCGPPTGFSELKLRMRRDDGAAVYLNGHRVWISNLPEDVGPDTPALQAVEEGPRLAWVETTLPTTHLLTGENILAVELHQFTLPDASDPGDLAFDLELLGIPIPAPGTDTLVPPGDAWAFWDRDPEGFGSADALWEQANYLDLHWQRGTAPLGYGHDNLETVINSQSASESGSNPSALFRKTFDVTDPSAYAGVHVFLMREDGASVFLNGTRVVHGNVFPKVSPFNHADKSIPPDEARQWRHWTFDPASLVPGRNLIAVSVHNREIDSTSLLFDLQLIAELRGAPEIFLQRTGDEVELAWPEAFTGWQLHRSGNLSEWEPVETAPLLDGGWFYVRQPIAAQQWFRLVRP